MHLSAVNAPGHPLASVTPHLARTVPRALVTKQSTATASRQSVVARIAYADTSSLVSTETAEHQKKYILGELLGSGTAAHVHAGTDSQTGLQYAVKILPKRKGGRDRTQLIRSEVRGAQDFAQGSDVQPFGEC